MNNINNFKFEGYNWTTSREDGRLIHPLQPLFWYDPSCSYVDDDGLHCFCRYNPKEIRHWDGVIYHPVYGVGGAMSIDEFSYGEYVIVAKLPEGPYMYPALWLSGIDSWPPEIDILEGYNTKYRKRYIKWPGSNFYGRNGIYLSSIFPSYKLETNVHYLDYEGLKKDIKGVGCDILSLKQPTKKYNTYKLIWTPELIEIYYNHSLVRKVTDKEILSSFNKSPRMRVLLTMSLYTKESIGDKVCDSELIIKSFKYTPYERIL